MWWPGISIECKRQVDCCLTWQRFGQPSPHSSIHPLVTDAPLQMVSIDFIESLDLTRHGFRYICSLVDVHTRYAEMQPTRNRDAAYAIQVIREVWLPRWGAPQILLADAAQAFESN